jgi:hypothetical protein
MIREWLKFDKMSMKHHYHQQQPHYEARDFVGLAIALQQ